jgi:hypothetical protein
MVTPADDCQILNFLWYAGRRAFVLAAQPLGNRNEFHTLAVSLDPGLANHNCGWPTTFVVVLWLANHLCG